MGDCTVLFSGGFRQILTVIVREMKFGEVNSSLKRSYIWPHITKLKHKTNMRILLSGPDRSIKRSCRSGKRPKWLVLSLRKRRRLFLLLNTTFFDKSKRKLLRPFINYMQQLQLFFKN